MKLPNIFGQKNKAVIVLERDQIDIYTPSKTKEMSIDSTSVPFDKSGAEFGEIISNKTLVNQLTNSLKKFIPLGSHIILVVGEQLVFKLKTKEEAENIPLEKSKLSFWQKKEDPKSVYAYNKDYVGVLTSVAENLNGSISAEYIKNTLPQTDFAKELLFSKKLETLKI